MTDTPRLPGQRTAATRLTLIALTRLPETDWTYAAELAGQFGATRKTVGGVLDRFAVHGWCEARWESDEDARARAQATADGRHIAKRRYYRLTDVGRAGVAGLSDWLNR